jgi:hypothetical protein
VFFAETLTDVPSESVKVDVVLPGDAPAELTLSIGVAEVEGARQIVNLGGTVTDGGGWEITYLGRGNPVNQGTLDAPVMSVPIKVQRYRKRLMETHYRQDSIVISADGSATVL